jgi:hypothetical protein
LLTASAGAAVALAADNANSMAAEAVIFPKVIANLPEFKTVSCR